MRIAVVTEVFLAAVDGVVTRLRRTLEQLARVGDEVLVVAPVGGRSSYAVGLSPTCVPSAYRPLGWPALARAVLAAPPGLVGAAPTRRGGAG